MSLLALCMLALFLGQRLLRNDQASTGEAEERAQKGGLWEEGAPAAESEDSWLPRRARAAGDEALQIEAKVKSMLNLPQGQVGAILLPAGSGNELFKKGDAIRVANMGHSKAAELLRTALLNPETSGKLGATVSDDVINLSRGGQQWRIFVQNLQDCSRVKIVSWMGKDSEEVLTRVPYGRATLFAGSDARRKFDILIVAGGDEPAVGEQ